jgi:hypothetical protein
MITRHAHFVVGATLLSLTLSATADIITFESDPAGPVPDGFMSADSPLVSFTNSFGLGLAIGNFGIASDGQGLAVGDNDTSFLIMDFSVLINSLSLDFGNDDPALTAPGDTAILTAYLDGVEVGQTVVLLNRNTAMDQTISFAGTAFNSASLDYYVTGDGLTKIVDNINFTPVPVPGALGMLAITGLLGRSRRRA